MVIKPSMYVGLHDVYPTMDLNFAFTRKVKITSFCNFVSLEDKMRKLLVKNWKRKKRRKRKEEKLLITRLDRNGAKFSRCVVVFLGEAE